MGRQSIEYNTINDINPHSERWRFTPISEYIELKFSDESVTVPDFQTIQSFRIDDSILFVIIDGKLNAHLSDSIPVEIQIEKLNNVISNMPKKSSKNLLDIFKYERNYFSAQNNIQFSDGLLIKATMNTIIKKPIQLLNIQTKTKIFPRIQIYCKSNSRLTIIEHYLNLTKNDSVSNSLVEVYLEKGANLKHVCMQEGSKSDWNFYNLAINQYKNSVFTSSIISLTGNRTVNDIQCDLIESGASIDLSGLYFSDNKAHIDNHTIINHSAPNTYSVENFKGIMTQKSSGIFNGLVCVKPNVKKINSSQINRNLLLSSDVRMKSNPQLEIYADDVKCSHGSTIGQIDDDALFYMQTRGISEINATKMLVKGFAEEILEKIKIKSIMIYIETFIGKLILKS